MIIDQDKARSILALLKKNGDDTLTREFRAIVAMARSRQQAKNVIEDQGVPILLHLIPFAILTNAHLETPVNWKSELKAFFGNIDIRNSGKRKKQWFSAEQIQDIWDASLTSAAGKHIKRQLLDKSEQFRAKASRSALVKGINDFFSTSKRLKDLGIELKYAENEFLSLFIHEKKIF